VTVGMRDRVIKRGSERKSNAEEGMKQESELNRVGINRQCR
jgi:hypothetical protein